MRNCKVLTWLVMLICLSYFVQGQTIKGSVLDKATQQPLSGATITPGKDQPGTLTDSAGNFSIDAHGAKSLQVSSVGYGTQSIPITGSGLYRIELQSAVGDIEQVVVVGYGSQKKVNLTGAVTNVDVTKTFGSKPLADPTRALQGVVPGLTITYGNGGLTTAPAINIRGLGSLNGSSRPLILVDNVETDDLSIINPSDIESVSVLKDAASTSIYGARAAFGVVLIKTKTGKRNQRTVVSYNNNFAWSTPTILPNFADPVKELTGIYEGSVRAGNSAPEVFGMELLKLRDGIANWEKTYANNRKGKEMVPGEDFVATPNAPTYFYRVWDVKKEMLNDWTAQQIHNFQIRGGSEKTAYYLSAGYNSQGGIIKMNPDKLKQYNITAAVNTTITKGWDVDLKMLYRNFEYDYPYQYQSYFYYMWRWGAYFPFGTYQGKYFRHVPAYLAAAQTSKVDDNYQRIDLGTTIDVVKHLSIRAAYSIGRDNVVRHETGGPVNAWDFWSAGLTLHDISTGASNSNVSYSDGRYLNNTFNAYATYENKFFGHHNLKLMAGINAEDLENIGFTATRRGVLDPSKGELSLATGDQLIGGNHSHSAFAGYFGRLNYDYRGKYLLELNTRYDGSSSFPTNDRWAFFSSGSAGWRVSEEDFFQNLKPTVSDFKLRGSYGTVGNQDVGGLFFVPSMPTAAVNWINNGITAQTVTAPAAVASSITWEKVTTLDLGSDIRFLNNNFGVTFDWYQRNTEGMLSNSAVPATFGTSAPKVNSGSLRTRGWEISLDGNYTVNKDLSLYGILTLSDYKTTITAWNNPTKLISDNYVGKTYGDIWGFETDRYFTADDTLSGLNKSQTALELGNFKYGAGDIKFKDLGGTDGKPDGKIDAGKQTASDHGDLKVIGNTQPRYLYSARIGAAWKNFDIDVYIQGVGKRNYWGIGDVALPLYRGGDILYEHQLDYWTPTHTDAKYPRPYVGNASGRFGSLAGGGNNFYPQTKYLLNLAYCRLKNVNIGYTLPHQILSKYKVSQFRIYVSGQNLAEISNVGVPLDPEITDGELSFIGRTFPFQRTVSFGVQLSF